MPTTKRVVARWVVAYSLVAAVGVFLVPASADATALKSPEPTAGVRTYAVAPAKRTVRRVHAPRGGAQVCRDNRKLRMGMASWYGGAALHRTASGEAFRADEFAAASRTLPFNTRVVVTNLHNGRSVVVRINDRGPFVRGRIIDLTPKAAAELGMKAHGTAPVYLEIVRRETQSAAVGTTEFDQR